MINRVVLVGRLTRDPELRRTSAGNSVATFTVAVDNRMKNPDGTRGTTFAPCVCFQQSADNMVKFTRKGSLVAVEGTLNQRKYTRKDGSTASVIEVICDSVQFLDPKPANAGVEEIPPFDDAPAPVEDSRNLDSLNLPDDDLPF